MNSLCNRNSMDCATKFVMKIKMEMLIKITSLMNIFQQFDRIQKIYNSSGTLVKSVNLCMYKRFGVQHQVNNWLYLIHK